MSLKRHRQTENEILSSLSNLKSDWKDDHARAVIQLLENFPRNKTFNKNELLKLLGVVQGGKLIKKSELDEHLTMFRLFLDCSKDSFTSEFKSLSGGKTPGVTYLKQHPSEFVNILINLGLLRNVKEFLGESYSWRDIMTERLKGGRGSAIQGQQRGRQLEDFIEGVLTEVFGEDNFDLRCQFTGSNDISKEKADFAIPSKKDPLILIEAKAYGATGSKQTDVIGDVNRIIAEKRNDTHFILVTDGITWRERTSDLRKLITMQNQGQITRIYTQAMKAQMIKDLNSLK